MKHLIVSILLFTSTLVQAQHGKINKGETWYRIYPNKLLQLKTDEEQNFYVEISSGKNLLFEYYMRKDEQAEISDDEYTEKIIFSVPKKSKSFIYKGETLKAAFLRGCFCMDRGWHEIADGYIKGKKINCTTWEVEMEVTTKADPSRNATAITKKINATFKVYKPSANKKK